MNKTEVRCNSWNPHQGGKMAKAELRDCLTLEFWQFLKDFGRPTPSLEIP